MERWLSGLGGSFLKDDEQEGAVGKGTRGWERWRQSRI
jgi:hypothetical protein